MPAANWQTYSVRHASSTMRPLVKPQRPAATTLTDVATPLDPGSHAFGANSR
jgi:hypothetical protein